MTRSSLFFTVLGSASRWQSRQSNAIPDEWRASSIIAYWRELISQENSFFFLWGRGAAVTLEILTCPTQVQREFSQELVFHQFHKIRSDFRHWKTIFPTGSFVQHVPATIRCTRTNHVVSNRICKTCLRRKELSGRSFCDRYFGAAIDHVAGSLVQGLATER